MNELDAVGPNESYADPEVKLFEERYRRAVAADSDRRANARQYWRTYSDDPWPEDARRQVEKLDGTPCVNFNYAFPVTNTILGDQMENRRNVVFRPVDLSQHDDVISNWATRIVRQIFETSHGHRAETRGIHDQLITGHGWVHAWVDHSKMPPRIVVDFVPETQMWRDPDANRDNFSDARFVIRETTWDRDDAIARWPASEMAIRARAGAGGDPFPRGEEPSSGEGSISTIDQNRNRISVFEYQSRRSEPWVAWRSEQSEELAHLPLAEFEKLFRTETEVRYLDIKDPATEKKASLQKFSTLLQADQGRYREISREEADVPAEHQQYPRDVYYKGILLRGGAGTSHWLEKPTRLGVDSFTYVCFNGFWKRVTGQGRSECFGIIEPIQGTQLLIAKVLTQAVQLLARSAKGGGFIDGSALADPKNFAETQGQPGKWHLLKPGVRAADAITQNPNISFPQFLSELLRICQTAIPQMTAVSEYLQGTSTRERSNVLITNLQSRAKTTLTPLYDPVESGRVQLGQLLLQMIQKYLPDFVIQQILGDDGDIEGVTYEMTPSQETGKPERTEIASAAALLKRQSVNDFHVSVDTGEATTYEKQAILSVMGQVMQTAADSGGPVDKLWPIMVRAFPLPRGKADQLASEMEEEIERMAALRTVEGIIEAIAGLAPEEVEQIMQQAEAVLQQSQPPQEQVAA